MAVNSSPLSSPPIIRNCGNSSRPCSSGHRRCDAAQTIRCFVGRSEFADPFSEPPPQYLGDDQAITSAYVNVGPGSHTVRHIPDVTGEPATALQIFTFPSTVTEVWGFGPRP